jgi:hypothetical protein
VHVLSGDNNTVDRGLFYNAYGDDLSDQRCSSS